MKAWVLYWKYHDEKGCDVLRAYLDEQRGQEDLALVTRGDHDREWLLVEVDLFERDVQIVHQPSIDETSEIDESPF